MVQYMNNNSGFNQWNANRNTTAKKSGFSGFLWWLLVFMAAWWMVGSIMAPKQVVTDAPVETNTVDMSSVPTQTITSDKISANVQGLRISDVRLNDFPMSSNSTEPVTLLSGDNDYIEVGFLTTGTTAPVANTVWREKDGTYTWRNSDGVEFTRTLNTDGYVITITDTIKNNSKSAVSVSPYARVVRENKAGAQSTAVANGSIVGFKVFNFFIESEKIL